MTYCPSVRSCITALGASVLALATLAAPAAATPEAVGGSTDPVPGLPVFLALGDSIAAGQQSAPRTDDYFETVTAWKANGYVGQLAPALREDLDCLPATTDQAADGCRHLQVVNLARAAVPALGGEPAKPGVRSATVIAEQLPTAVEMLRSRNGDDNPRNDVEVITLTVGGNDIFGPVLSACIGGVTTACSSTIQGSFNAFSANYSTILAELRAAAGPDTAIVTMTYFNPIAYCNLGQVPGAVQLGDYVLEGVPVSGLGPVGFNGLITAISGQHGAMVADTYGVLGAGDFVGGSDCLHPDRSGHTEIAEVFVDAVLP